MKQNLRLAAFAAAVSMLMAGCATQQQEANGPDTEAHARQIILKKVDAAVDAQRDLAATTAEGKQMQLRKQAALDGDEVDIDYIGKPQPLLEAIAHRYGYRYVETGKRVDLRTINLRAEKKPILEVLRDVSLQIDAGADVVLDKDAKVVRLIYKHKQV